MSENQESKKINLKDFSPKNVLLENDRFMPITVKNTVRFFVTDIFSGILFAPDFVFPVTQPVSGPDSSEISVRKKIGVQKVFGRNFSV